ncbi:MAG: hypothetical protein H6585_04255 [Flavobacteriales bacterium]|nr:hypothetical protein [Flavobacteriales bacterium]MCB9447538.1 hypothetical protein [Flavobacteriales bacterium]
MLGQIIDILLLLAFSFLSRLPFVMVPAGDTRVHLWQIKKAKTRGIGGYETFQSVIKGFNAYPNFFHWVLSKLPEGRAYLIGIMACIGFDIVGVLFVYALLEYLIGSGALPLPMGMDAHHLSFMGAILYASTPVFFPVIQRLKTISGRTLGNFLSIGYFASLYGMMYLHPVAFLGCLVFGLLILMSSQFAMQVMVLFSLGMTLYSWSVYPIAVLLGVVLIGLLIPRTGTYKLFVMKINHYQWYFDMLRLKKSPVAKRNSFSDLLKLPIDIFRNPDRAIESLFRNNTLLIAVLSVPMMVYMIYDISMYPERMQMFRDQSLLAFLAGLVCCSLGAFVLTSFRPFKLLGEAERYFDYGAPALIVVFLVYVLRWDPAHSDVLMTRFLLLNLCVIAMNFLYLNLNRLKRSFLPEPIGEMKPLIDYFEALKSNRNTLVIPTKDNFTLGTFVSNPHARFYYPYTSDGKLNAFNRLKDDEVYVNFPTPDLGHFVNKYDVNTLVLDKRFAKDAKDSMGVDYADALRTWRKEFENERYVIYGILDT